MRGSIRAQPAMLERAVLNVLDNAAKWSPPGSTIRVRLRRDESWTLEVLDQGPGIAADDLPHVFDRFYRAESARSLPGSGLGLAIVQQVITSHGGSVTAASPRAAVRSSRSIYRPWPSTNRNPSSGRQTRRTSIRHGRPPAYLPMRRYPGRPPPPSHPPSRPPSHPDRRRPDHPRSRARWHPPGQDSRPAPSRAPSHQPGQDSRPAPAGPRRHPPHRCPGPTPSWYPGPAWTCSSPILTASRPRNLRIPGPGGPRRSPKRARAGPPTRRLTVWQSPEPDWPPTGPAAAFAPAAEVTSPRSSPVVARQPGVERQEHESDRSVASDMGLRSVTTGRQSRNGEVTGGICARSGIRTLTRLVSVGVTESQIAPLSRQFLDTLNSRRTARVSSLW